MTKNNGILLVPSAKLVPNELKIEVGPIPSGMIPLEGKPVIEHIADLYERECDRWNFRRVVACEKEANEIVNWISTSDYDWRPVVLDSTNSIGETIYKALHTLFKDDSAGWNTLFINFADTLIYPPCHATETDQVTYDLVNHPLRWTTFETTSDGEKIDEISAKFSNESGNRLNTFVGNFQLTAPEQFCETLSTHFPTTNRSSSNIDPLYNALLEYLTDREYNLTQPRKWIDVGHIDTYYRSKTAFFNTREFNDVCFDETRNTITKIASKDKVLIPEIRWYRKLPIELQPFTPQVFDSEIDGNPSIELEYIGYPPLSDIHLYGNHKIHIWKNVFTSLFDIVKQFQEFELTGKDPGGKPLRTMYLQKTRDRLNKLQGAKPFNSYFESDKIRINGTTFNSLSRVMNSIEDDLTEMGLLDPVRYTIIHGDLCFPNILHDIRTGVNKLVDPRGSFGSLDIHGDYRYDLAKLLHSIHGHYEFIINDRFDITYRTDGIPEIEYTVHTEDRHERREQLFHSMISAEFPDVMEQVHAIESLLWLSMVPLHADETDRQVLMMAQGIKKYNDYF